MKWMTLFCVLAAPAQACPGGQQLFSCTLKGGTALVQVCHTGDAASYIFGPAGRPPDIVIAASVRALDNTPWNGIGGAIYDDVGFVNGDFAYTVWQSIDKAKSVAGDFDAISGGIEVTKGDQSIARLACDAGTVEAALDAVFGLKEEAGQCYDRSAFAWKAC